MDKIKRIVFSKRFMFLLAFTVMFVSLYNIDFLGGSGDAKETWSVIKTFFSKTPYASYVMYKGIYSFVPGLISYHFGQQFGLDEFLLLKVFNALMYAYLVIYGLPQICNYFFPNKFKGWQYYLLGLVLYILDRQVFYFLSVDVISCFLFVLLINVCIKLKEDKKESLSLIIFGGMLIGLNLAFSGQYSFSAMFIILYYLFIIVKRYRKKLSKMVLCLFVLIGCIAVSKGIDVYYVKTVVNPARENGAWIPNASEWVNYGYSANLLLINYPASLPDNLSMGMVKASNGEAYELIKSGGTYYNLGSYIDLIVSNPVKFIVRWCERLFLGSVNDYQNLFPNYVKHLNSLSLFIMLIFIYISYYLLTTKYKHFKDIFCLDTIILIAFLFTALVPSFSHVENRYYFTVRTLLISFPIMSSLLYDFYKKIKDKKVDFSEINYKILGCLLFMLLGTIIYFAIYQSKGL